MVFSADAQLRCEERKFLHRLCGICLPEGVSRPGVRSAGTVHVWRMEDIFVLLHAHRKPLLFLQLFNTRSIVHLKLHTDGDVSLFCPGDSLSRCSV